MNTIPRSIYHRPWTIGAALAAPILPLLSQASPNLVFIMADQYRGDALGCIGKEPVKTPCLDKLASEGIVFTDAVSQLSCFITRKGYADDGHVPYQQ